MAPRQAPAVGPLGPALVPSSPKGSGWPDGALRSIRVRASHLGQTGRGAEQPVVRLLRL